jgi:hypothetical protein
VVSIYAALWIWPRWGRLSFSIVTFDNQSRLAVGSGNFGNSGRLYPVRNVYAILRRREAYKADVISVNAKWGLAEWNPEIPPRSNMIPEKKPR